MLVFSGKRTISTVVVDNLSSGLFSERYCLFATEPSNCNKDFRVPQNGFFLSSQCSAERIDNVIAM